VGDPRLGADAGYGSRRAEHRFDATRWAGYDPPAPGRSSSSR
jgi:hypothetical protein